ncbi:MAG TPA: ribosome maturation factor RimM [Gammaproteobacteria bacterium]|nr:ribosome maturation factor RimM [Gammaproteobacteria bacterium]
MSAGGSEEWIELGRISGFYGVRGWVRVFSHTDPRAGILSYSRWFLGAGEERREYRVDDGRMQGGGVVAALIGVENREAARGLLGLAISVPRRELPPIEGFYWADLIGLAVENRTGIALGHIVAMLETGGHDVMVIADRGRERLIPWAPGRYVDGVSLAAGRVTVDWDPDD